MNIYEMIGSIDNKNLIITVSTWELDKNIDGSLHLSLCGCPDNQTKIINKEMLNPTDLDNIKGDIESVTIFFNDDSKNDFYKNMLAEYFSVITGIFPMRILY